MKKQVLKTTDKAARLASERVRIYREPFALAPWDRDHTDAPLVYWSQDYDHAENATDAPRIENEDGEQGETLPGVLCAQVYAYEHGGVTFSTRPQSCGGVPCGCVWCTVEAFRDYYGDGVDIAVAVEEWNAAARDWDYIDGCGGFYPRQDDAATLAALIGPGVSPGRIVCADDDAAQFVGMEYDDGAPMDGPTVAQCDAA